MTMMNIVLSSYLKGTCSLLVKFVYNFFLPKIFMHQQYEAIFKQNYHFQTHCAWNRATRGIRTLNFNLKI